MVATKVGENTQEQAYTLSALVYIILSFGVLSMAMKLFLQNIVLNLEYKLLLESFRSQELQ
jgi:hypothetical protein